MNEKNSKNNSNKKKKVNSKNRNYKKENTNDIDLKKQEKDLESESKEKEVDNSFLDVGKDKEKNAEYDKKTLKKKSKISHLLLNAFLVLVLLVALIIFGASVYDKNSSAVYLISNLFITLFTILFVVIGISSKKKGTIFFSGLLLLGYFILTFSSTFNLDKFTSTGAPDFSGKSLTYVMKWASSNNVTVKQEYEYSDMVDEYKIISQNVEAGAKLDNLKEITVSVSEGPNPSKEVIIPSMITWDSERVLSYVRENFLSNVVVEFVASDKAQDTVIEQSTSGTIKRDDEVKLTFSYGEELGYDEVTLIDFTGKSEFEVEFYMKQHQLRYEFDKDFSSKQKRGYAMKQSVKATEKVKINDRTIKVTISKGPKIKIPDLKGMSMTEATEWAIKNKLKLEFSDKYDDSVKENEVISINYDKGEVIEEGTTVKIVLSKGKLKMSKFKSLNEFREWADKYEIKYEEKHEFNDEVAAGEVISYSHKNGDIIKNDDTIVVTISDGKRKEVPNVKGLSKSEAISKLEKAGLNYNFVYKSSNDVSKDKVISQSISAGSEVSQGTTVTVTISSGKKESSSGSSSGNSSSGSSNNSSNNDNKPVQECDKSKKKMVYIDPSFISNNPSTTCSSLKAAYPGIKFSCSYVKDPGLSNGMIQNSASIDEHEFNYCDTYTVKIVSN